jgi:hypothetical protein
MASKRQVEKPSNSAINADYVMWCVRGIGSENFLCARSSGRHVRRGSFRKRRPMAMYHLRKMPQQCPRDVEIIDVRGGLAQDRHGAGRGFPASIPNPSDRETQALPVWAIPGERTQNRANWAKGLEVKVCSEEMEFVFPLLLSQL